MRIILLLSLFIVFSCSTESTVTEVSEEPVQAYTVGGDPLYIPVRSKEQSAKLESDLDSARKNWETNPSEMNYIWYGRRMAYINRYPEAIEIFNEGLEKFPDSFKLLRHRGHRYISIREFDKAISDLSKAASLIEGNPVETEPDGMPNRLNIPLSNTHFNIYYHLGLAYYLKQEWQLAEIAYRKCMEYSVNDDLVTATADWLYMTLVKQSKAEEAAELLETITEDMEIIENDSYHKRLLMYKGLIDPAEVFSDNLDSLDAVTIATQGYGVGNYYLSQGDTARAMDIFRKVTSGQSWSAFGFIAAEVELYLLANS